MKSFKAVKIKINFLVWFQIIIQILFPLLASFSAHASPSGNRETMPFSASANPLTLTTLANSTASNGNDGLKNTAANMATGAAASSVQEWLNQFGTAQIKLNVDNNGNWDDSAFDFLAPLYDNKKGVLFTQLGVRAPDGRTIGNFGLGVRTFNTENWMFGGNVFLDDDFTGQNRRVGFGAEVWTNYLKLAANTYAGTTEWHSSRDFDGYNEKPADGYDLRAEGYLPAYPQLGAKMMYEQYYGDKVALFDKDHLQNNPSAVTVGLNYTPVPLITASVDYKRGQDSMDDTQFSLNFRYSIGQSWGSQISPDQVAIRRSLAGSRYDLVDRNNEIILQYKKKESTATLADMTLTSIKDNSPADGTTVNTVTVHATTSDGKPVSGAAIAWSITGSAKLISPAGVTDPSGNASVNITNTTAEQVIVTATSGAISRTTPSAFVQYAASLNLQLTKNNSHADGNDQNAGQVIVKDASGKVMSGAALAWQVGTGATIDSSDNNTDTNGKATVHFTSTSAGTVKLSATALGKSESVNASFVTDVVQTVAATMATN
ncbi:MAG: inverse autotransporter beta domain-containing protein, partial [Lachnospiraceae bacterium]